MSMTDNAAAIDHDRVRALLEVMGAERLGQLLQVFEARVAGLTADLMSGAPDFDAPDFDAPDFDALRAVAHQSRGAAGSLGLYALAESLGRLEILLGPAADPSAVASAAAELTALQARAYADLAMGFPGLSIAHASAGALNR